MKDRERVLVISSRLPAASSSRPPIASAPSKLPAASSSESSDVARSLLQLTSTGAVNFESSGLDNDLGTLRVQLEELTSREEQREFALEVEILRREVQIMFEQKFNQATGDCL